MPTFRLRLEYDGTDFAGWQTQAAGVRTVQGTLEAALARIAGEPVGVVGAGRTDAGVHAEGQVASLRLETRLDAAALGRALNAILPPDLAVREAAEAAPDFHALRDARAKRYRYQVWNGRVRSPLRARRFHWTPLPLDLGAMRVAAAACVGRHDFACFETRSSEHPDPGHSTVRRLDAVAVHGVAGGEIAITVDGEGFLRHMVRSLAGTLLEAGAGRRDPAGMPALLAGRDRRQAGPTAPAAGLVLVRVDY